MTLTTTAATVTALLLIPIAVTMSNHGTDIPHASINTAASMSTTISETSATPTLLAQANETVEEQATETTSGAELRAVFEGGTAIGIVQSRDADESDAAEWSDFDQDYWNRIAGTRSRLVTEGHTESGDVETRNSIDVTPRVLGDGAGRSLAELDQNTELEFVDTPLDEALEYLAQLHNVPIHLHKGGLKLARVSNDAPVTAAIKDVKLRDALSQILEPLNLRAVVDTGGLVVTSQFDAPARHDNPEKRIHEALKTNTRFTFEAVPLNDALGYISQAHGISIRTNDSSLREVDVPLDVPVSIHSFDGTLDLLLTRILKPLGLTYSVNGDYVYVVAQENSNSDATETDQAEIQYFVRDGNLYRRVVRLNESTENNLTADDGEIQISAIEQDGESALKIESGSGSTVLTTSELRLKLPDLVGDDPPLSGLETNDRAYAIRDGKLQRFDYSQGDDSEPALLWEVTSHEGVMPNKHLMQKLAETTSIKAENKPFQELIAEISEKHGIRIIADRRRLSNGDVWPDTPVSVDVGNTELGKAFAIMLETIDCRYLLGDEALIVTPAYNDQYTIKVADDGESIRLESQNPTVSAERIENELNQRTVLEFVDTPLSEAIDYISQFHNITILIQEVPLSDYGLATDTPVNLVIHNVKLKSALDLMLEPLELDYVIENEVMQVTTRVDADALLETRVYDLPEMRGTDPEMISELVIKSVGDAGTWETTGGPGTTTPVNDGLVVRTSQRVHREIEALFEQLEAHSAGERAQPDAEAIRKKKSDE